jgi:hypothetical protein
MKTAALLPMQRVFRPGGNVAVRVAQQRPANSSIAGHVHQQTDGEGQFLYALTFCFSQRL